jgi:hypothetical protein
VGEIEVLLVVFDWSMKIISRRIVGKEMDAVGREWEQQRD